VSDVIAVAPALFDGVRRRHALTAVIEDQPRQQAGFPGASSVGPLDAVRGKHLLNLVPEALIDNGSMLTGVTFALVNDPTTMILSRDNVKSFSHF